MKAFPLIVPKTKFEAENSEYGMDLRDYFAAKAMQAILNSSVSAYYNGTIQNYDHKRETEEAYQIADAMMEARNEK